MGEDSSNAIGKINGFINGLVGCGRGKWFYSLGTEVRVDMSGAYIGMWTEDLKVSFIHNRDGKSKVTALDFWDAKIVLETDKMLTIDTKNGNITLGYN